MKNIGPIVKGVAAHPGNAKAKLRWLLVFGAAYLIFPIDLIPDVMPILGWADDLTILTMIAGHAIKVISTSKKKSRL